MEVKRLLEAGAPPSAPADTVANVTPLHAAGRAAAALPGHDAKGVVQTLCDFGADLDARDSRGNTPLHAAAGAGAAAAVAALLDAAPTPPRATRTRTRRSTAPCGTGATPARPYSCATARRWARATGAAGRRARTPRPGGGATSRARRRRARPRSAQRALATRRRWRPSVRLTHAAI